MACGVSWSPIMPDWKPEIRARLAGLALEPTREDEIVEELNQHLEDRHADLVQRGTPAPEARRLLLEELAAVDLLQKELRRIERPAERTPPVLGAPASGRVLGGLWGDVRHGLRSLRKNPGLTVTALLTLALGIGANATIFSVVNAVLLRPLPFADPEALVTFWGSAPQMGLPVVNYPEAFLVHFRSRSRTLDPIGAYNSGSITLTGAGEPERLWGAVVTADFFNVLGMTPLHGRTFLPEEETRGRHQVAVLSHGLWQRRFGGDPGIVGKGITLDDSPTTVVGVMPPGFDFPRRAELWVPLAIEPGSLNCWCFATIGRLARGRTPDDVSREIGLLSDDFWRERNGEPPRDPNSTEGPKSIVIAKPLSEDLVRQVRTPLLVLLGCVAMVLLIACANVANLLLARATARGREIAVRCCLGASPWRMVRQLVVESVLLALGGTTVGLALAFWTVRALSRVAVERVSHVQEIGLDGSVLFFTLGVTFATVLLFGLAPALRGARIDLQEVVKEGARGSRGAGSRWLNNAFVVSQFALCLVLLIGAGLLLRSFRNLLAVELGFRPENVLVGRVTVPWPAYEEDSRRRAFFAQLAERVRSLPGVRSAGLSSSAPFSEGSNQQTFFIRGREPGPDQPKLVASIRAVTPGYFPAVATPLLRGRVLEEADTEKAPLVTVVDETLARRFWPDGNALGHELRLGDDGPWRTIVGVVAAVKHEDVGETPNRYVYLPHAQLPSGQMDVVVRTAADPASLTGVIRREVQALDPTLPFYDVHTMEEAIARSLATRRLTNQLLLGFAVAALVLAAIGIYGVIALSVSHRVSEFGIRLALGAAPADVCRLVLRQGLRLILVGVVIGLAAAAALTRSLASLLFEVQPLDPLIFAGVALMLVSVAVLACYLPARRATATDPLVALRYE
jgi:putative ABC transport system permease protein